MNKSISFTKLLLLCAFQLWGTSAGAQGCPPLPAPLSLPVGLQSSSRTFHMGFVNFPHTSSVDCGDPRDINSHYIKNFGDLMVIHEDGGVPWDAALQKWYKPELKAFPTQYPLAYQGEIRDTAKRRDALPASHKVSLYVNYMNFMKTALADERKHDPMTGARILTALPKEYRYQFNADYFVLAYIAHLTYLIDIYRPDFIGFGIENNLLLTRIVETAATPDPNDDIPYQAWVDFHAASKRIYTYLKLMYPQKRVYFSIAIDDYNFPRTFDFGVNLAAYNVLLKAIQHTQSNSLYNRYIDGTVWQREHLKMTIQFSDLVAVSTYPYMDPRYSNPTAIPADYFTRIQEIAPTKPYAFAETGFIAEPLRFPEIVKPGENYTLDIFGSSLYQAQYLGRLMSEAQKVKAVYINWFIARDYDQMWTQQLAAGPDALINRIWRDIGIFDGNGGLRLSGLLWQVNLKRPVVGN
ncbi:MAG: hypothetical protein K2X47_14000 [Bdellovibrionales bacterium]|nr:hypothetical protein [Bdellovibrionales bacterium]